MKMTKKMQTRGWVRQQGMTLIELLVASTISIIAVGGMLAAMASTLGTGTQTIQMTRMTGEMRTAMQIMSRELRRANYHSHFLSCYGNTGCLKTLPDLGDITGKIRPIGIVESGDVVSGFNDCIWFWYERPGSTTLSNWAVAGFRREVDGDEIGRIQMTTGSTSSTPCSGDTEWVNATGKGADITDPEFINILGFNVVDESPLPEIINALNHTQTVQRIGLTITAELRADGPVPPWLQNNANATRTLTEFIQVRNYFTTAPTP
jgi:type II secretory pathway pseudopilin PulG